MSEIAKMRTGDKVRVEVSGFLVQTNDPDGSFRVVSEDGLVLGQFYATTRRDSQSAIVLLGIQDAPEWTI